MNELWNYFKEIPMSVKFKYFIALPLGILLFVIIKIGELANELDGVLSDWVRNGR